jgi:hypothetical protein
LALAGLVLMTGLVGVDVGALAVARAAAQTAADLAALAALAPQVEQTAPRAARAAGIAAANGAELVGCACSAVQAVVRVRRRLRLVPGGLIVSVTATARAVLALVPPAGRAAGGAVDLLRAVDENQAKPLRDALGGEAAGRPARQRQRGDGGGAVRRLGHRGQGRRPGDPTGQPRGPQPATVTTYAMLIGAALLLPAALVEGLVPAVGRWTGGCSAWSASSASPWPSSCGPGRCRG